VAFLWIGLIAAAAAVIVVTATDPHGAGLSPDSAVYLSGAEALAHGHGFRAYGGVPLTDFPPGYPLALAAWLAVFGGAVGDAARAVNAASVFALALLVGLVLRRYVTRTALLAAGVVLVASAPALLHTGVTAWSETLFSACIMACLLFLARALASWRMPDVALAGAWASACIGVRFVGAGVVVAGLVALVAAGRSRVRGGLLKHCLVFAGLAAVIPAAWVASRLTITDSPLGVRNPPRAGLLSNAGDAAKWMGHWFVPDTFSAPLRLLGYAVAASALGAGVVLWTRSRLPARPREPARALWLPALVAGSVVAATVVGASLTETDRLDFRLLSPALAPAVVLIIGAADRLLDRSPGRVAVGLAALVVAAWVAASLGADARVWRDVRKGEGYASAESRSSKLAGLLRVSASGGQLYSNRPDEVWLLTRRDARCPPVALGAGPCAGLSVPRDLRHGLHPPAQLAWFRAPDVGAVPRGSGACRVSRAAALRDGVLFRVTGTGCGAA
jgi:hypothetical protein